MTYIPTKDADLAIWSQNFADLLVADPPRYGTDAATASLIAAENDAWEDAYAIAVNPATRTPVAVAHKDGTKALFLADARAQAALIRSNAGVTDADKAALGLTIPDPVPTPIPTPTTYPLLGVELANATTHLMVFADQLTPDKKAKPFGVMGCLVYRTIATTPQTDFDAANPILIYDATKTPFFVDVPTGNTGKIATYWGQWFTRTGKFGPISAPFSFVCP